MKRHWIAIGGPVLFIVMEVLIQRGLITRWEAVGMTVLIATLVWIRIGGHI